MYKLTLRVSVLTAWLLAATTLMADDLVLASLIMIAIGLAGTASLLRLEDLRRSGRTASALVPSGRGSPSPLPPIPGTSR